MTKASSSPSKLSYYERCKAKAFRRWQQVFLYRALVRAAWNVSQAARYCGLDRNNFRRMLKAAGVSVKRPQAVPKHVRQELRLEGRWWLERE